MDQLLRAIVAALALAAAAGAAAAGKCELKQIAQWPLRADSYRPAVDGAINGQKVGILLDTGAGSSVLRGAAAAKLGVGRDASARAPRLFGLGGETRVETVVVGEFRIGDAVRRNWPALLAGEEQFSGDLAFYLGNDFFRQAEVEFDLAHQAVRLFQATDCATASLAYWSKDAQELPLEAPGRKIEFAVTINGHALVAQLDSGATLSMLSMVGARQLGLSPQTPGVTAAGCISGFGSERLDAWLATLESFTIGNETIRNAQIPFADLWQHTRAAQIGSNIRRQVVNVPDLLLGADFLRAHRVFVSNAQRKIYFSYVGGTVFRGAAGKPCSAPQSG